MTTATIDLASAIASFEQTIAHLQNELAEIGAWLQANPSHDYDGASYTVVVRVISQSGQKSTPSGLRKVGEGFNFNGTTPATVHGLSHSAAQANAMHFNRAAIRDGKRDVEYSVMGLRALFVKQEASKAESLAFMQECVAKHKEPAAL